MKRPMAYILLYFIAGIISGSVLAYDLLGIFLVSVVVFLSIVILYNYYNWNKVFFLMIFYVVGALLFINAAKVDNKYIINKAEVEGVVTYAKETTSNNTKIYVNVEKLNGKKVKFKIYDINLGNNNLQVSDVVKLYGNLQLLEKNPNKGEYSEFYYEKSQGVSYKMLTTKVNVVSVRKNLEFYLASFRQKLANNFDVLLPPKEASIVKAIMLGDKDGFDPEITNLYKIGGIYHILSISGLHIGILAAFLFGLFKYIFKNNYSSIITIIILILYTILTGASISTVRAVSMCSIFLFADIVQRKNNGLNSLFVVAFVLLFYQPLYIFRAGFLMSFGAVIGILTLSSPLEKFLIYCNSLINNAFISKFNRYFIPYLTPAVAAFVFTTPIICYFFYFIYPYSIIVNLLVGFTIPVLIILSFVVGLISLVSMGVASFLSATIYYILFYYQYVCTFFSKMPNNKILTGCPNLFTIILYFFIVIFFMYSIKNKKITYKISFAVSVAFFMLIPLYNNIFSNGINIDLLNNGGDTIVIRDKNKAYFVDNPIKDSNIPINYLESCGIKKFDSSFVSILDKNHSKGTINLMNQNMVDKVYIEKNQENDMEYVNYFNALAKQDNIQIITLEDNKIVGNKKINMFFNANNFVLMYNNIYFSYINQFIGKNENIIVYDKKGDDLSSITPDIIISRFSKDYICKNLIEKQNINIYLKIVDNKIILGG